MGYKLFFGLILFHFIIPSKAQLLKERHIFTHTDSLRGFLSKERASFHVRFYDLNIKVVPEKHFIEGGNKITFVALKDLKILQLDLFKNLNIIAIKWGLQTLKYSREENTVWISFPKIIRKNTICTINFEYSGNPIIAKNPPWDGGFTWAQDSFGKPWVGVSCQGIGASLWWPNKDHPSDEVDSMMIRVSVPNGLMDVSNGRLMNTVDMGNGYTRFDWFVGSPINNYGVTINVGNYTQFSESFQDLSCDYFVLPEHEKKARKQFLQVRSMLNSFTYYFGPYPFKLDGYKLIESPYLGMEHQSAIAYGNHFQNGYLGKDLSHSGYGLTWDYIIIHESAHEWFGNNISSKDIADLWVHESFATYAEGLYVEFNQGYSAGQKYIFGLRSDVQNDSPIQGPFQVNHEGSEDMYFKGANMLNTLRHIINKDSVWFGILKKMNQVFYHKTRNGVDIINFICKESQMDLHPIFNQYLKTVDIPILNLKWEDSHTLSFKWTHCIKGFNMPIDIIMNKDKKIRLFPVDAEWKNIHSISRSDFPDLHADNEGFYIGIDKVSVK